MHNIQSTKRLAALELKEGLEGSKSWHHQYKNSAYIFVGNLNPGLTEGDVVIVFSQFGDIVDVNLARDKTTGKSKGFAFVCFEDQRSTILAVDNMNGYELLKKPLRVDHVEKYKAPKQFDENEKDEEGNPKLLEYKASGAEGKGYQVYNVLNSQKKLTDIQKERQERLISKKAVEDEDEAWAKAFEDSVKGLDDMPSFKQIEERKKLEEQKKELKKMKKEAKELKKLAKKVKKAKKEKASKKEEKEGKKAKKEESSEDSSSDS